MTEDIQIVEYKETSVATCYFAYGDKTFCIEVQQYHREEGRISKQTFEKDTMEVEQYYSNGRAFYIMSNNAYNLAIYSSGHTVITINGNLSLEFLKQIIDSIGV